MPMWRMPKECIGCMHFTELCIALCCRIDWLSDEIEGVAEPEDVAKVEGLFEEAVQDYLSIGLWQQYLE
jgi:hypothetical protein